MKERPAPRRNLIMAAASIYARFADAGNPITTAEALRRHISGVMNGSESGRKSWAKELDWARWEYVTIRTTNHDKQEYEVDVHTVEYSWDNPKVARFHRDIKCEGEKLRTGK